MLAWLEAAPDKEHPNTAQQSNNNSHGQAPFCAISTDHVEEMGQIITIEGKLINMAVTQSYPQKITQKADFMTIRRSYYFVTVDIYELNGKWGGIRRRLRS